MNTREVTFDHNNNNSQSFYQHLDDHQIIPDLIIIQKQHQGIQKLLHINQRFITADKYVIIDQNNKEYQMMYLTNYRIIVDKKPILSIPYGYIQQIKQLQKYVKLILKTGVTFQLFLDNYRDRFEDHIYKGLNMLPLCFNGLSQCQTPNIYDSYAQIQRMRVDSRHYSVFKNANGKFCPSYPLYFLIPKGVESSNLNQIRKCRYYSRIPVMCFYNQRSNVGMWRASKRKQQISGDILKFDTSYLRQIPGSPITLQLQQNSQGKSNSNFQTLTGLKMSFIQLTKQYSSNLQNPHHSKGQLFKTLGRWYEQIDKLISLAYYVVDLISQGHHVLLQQTYAFDRVPQVLVIAQIIMDPFFRTFDGFSILIEKQFISFGHPFQDRCGFNKNKQYEAAPIFIQLLECIHQMIVTHPNCFEYSSAYIAKIGYQIYTTKYKNFVSRGGQPKKQKKYSRCSKTIWNQCERQRCHYNYQYDQNTKKQLWEIRRKPSIKEYIIWAEYFDIICMMENQKKVGEQNLAQIARLKNHFAVKKKKSQ